MLQIEQQLKVKIGDGHETPFWKFGSLVFFNR